MKKHIHYLILIGFLSIVSCNKEKEIKIQNDDFKWTVNIPKNFKEVSEKIQAKRGENTDSQGTTLFVYKNGRFNTFESNFLIFDSKISGNYFDSNKETFIMAYKTFEEKFPNSTMDSITSKQIISGLEFERVEINLNLPNNIKLTSIGFHRLFGDKDFTVNVVYINDKIGNELIDNVLNSKFELNRE